MPFANRRTQEQESQGSKRKLIRPAIADFKNAATKRYGNNTKAKPAPPEQTNAENFYYLKQMNARTPMVIIMTDGEEIRGWIEWYDRNCLKVNREGAPNLLIQKHCIKYVFKEEELQQGPVPM
jgi:sRNA-binding regulator protein Hfq